MKESVLIGCCVQSPAPSPRFLEWTRIACDGIRFVNELNRNGSLMKRYFGSCPITVVFVVVLHVLSLKNLQVKCFVSSDKNFNAHVSI